MGAGALEMHTGVVGLIDQQPIRLYVQIAVSLPVPFQGMVAEPDRQRRIIDEQLQDMPKFRHVLAALGRQLHVSLKLARIAGFPHSDTQLLE